MDDRDHCWTQINVALSLRHTSFRAASWPLLHNLASQCERGEGGFWFVRKPPGLRLRFFVGGVNASERAQILREPLLRDAVARGQVDRWWCSVYEPEVHRLGGSVMLPAVHDLFIIQARVWVQWERLRRREHVRVSAEVMALALYDDLVQRASEAPEEAWAVWAALHQVYTGRPPHAPMAGASMQSSLREATLQRVDAAERSVLEHGFVANARFVRALDDAWQRGDLVGGRRALLGALAGFHFNMWCLTLPSIQSLCRSKVVEHHPSLPFLAPVTP